MTPEEMYCAVLEALADHDRQRKEASPTVPRGMVGVEPFDAVTEDDENVRVVGIFGNPESDQLEFIVIKIAEDGEIIPTTESALWRIEETAA